MSCISKFGIIYNFNKNKDYSNYEPKKYNCIDVEDDIINDWWDELTLLKTYFHNYNRPRFALARWGVTLIPPESLGAFYNIGDISFLGALLSLISSLFPNFLNQFGLYTMPLPIFSDTTMQILLPLTLLIASYGFLKLKIWGYWLLIIYDISFLISNIIFYHQNKQLFQNVAMIFIELIFILPTLKYFSKKTFIQ